jgi:hypothetical protein
MTCELLHQPLEIFWECGFRVALDTRVRVTVPSKNAQRGSLFSVGATGFLVGNQLAPVDGIKYDENALHSHEFRVIRFYIRQSTPTPKPTALFLPSELYGTTKTTVLPSYHFLVEN